MIAQFVVTESGKVDVSTVRFLQSTNDLFAGAVRTALTEIQFQPATHKGKRVKQLVQQAFLFRLDAVSPRVVVQRSTPETGFVLELAHSWETGWTARCAKGCKWKELTATCADCRIRLDDSGVRPPAARDHEEPAKFAFEIQARETGWEAKGISGLKWTKLSWDCGKAGCRARIDESGVRGL